MFLAEIVERLRQDASSRSTDNNDRSGDSNGGHHRHRPSDREPSRAARAAARGLCAGDQVGKEGGRGRPVEGGE